MSLFGDDSPVKVMLRRFSELEQGPLLSRLEDLRARLIRIMVVIFAVFCLTFAFAQQLLHWLCQPLTAALPAGVQALHFKGPLEVFVAYVQVSFMTATCLAAPLLISQIWAFVKPALPDTDHSMAGPFFVSALLLFVSGVSFCFYVIMPTALSFLLAMGEGVATPTIMVADYVGMTTLMLLGFGVVFQLPLLVILLERLGVVNIATLQKSRAYVLVGILVVAAIVTPTPDPFSQLAMGGPMYVMFEISLIIIKFLQRKERRQALVTNKPAPGPPKA